jgi:ubiquinone/menaquinone biosynthesis C-methylase UbiE
VANFNPIAPVYDFLSSLVFGKELIHASACFIHKLPAYGHILYIGGGSGKLLNKILANRPNITLDFVEPSLKFLQLAKRNLNTQFNNQVNFILGNHLALTTNKKYDAILTFFVVDIFTQNQTAAFCKHIFKLLQNNGLWLNTDFENPPSIKGKVILKTMYIFFKLVAKISAKQLPNYQAVFKELSLTEISNKLFFNQMVSASLFQKS